MVAVWCIVLVYAVGCVIETFYYNIERVLCLVCMKYLQCKRHRCNGSEKKKECEVEENTRAIHKQRHTAKQPHTHTIVWAKRFVYALFLSFYEKYIFNHVTFVCILFCSSACVG